MANKSVFATIKGKLLPRADAMNHAGAQAYALTPHQALAQLASTGTMNATFYAEPREQLDEVLKLSPRSMAGSFSISGRSVASTETE